MGKKKNKLPGEDYCKILDEFGEQAARDTLKDVNDGKVRASTIQKYLYNDGESREEYIKRLHDE